MANNDPYGDDGNGFAGLRKQLKEEKRLRKEAEARLVALEQGQYSRSIREALTERGLNPQVAKFYPAGRPTTDDSVDEWVEENRALFGFPQKPEASTESTVPEEVRRGYQNLKDMSAAETYTEMDFKSKLAAASNEAEVMELLRTYQPPMQ